MSEQREDVRALAKAVEELVLGAYRGMARSFDVSRIGLLQLAASSGPLRPTDAADSLAVNPSTVTRTAQALERDGLVGLAPDPRDGRSCLIGVTEAGRAQLARFEEAGIGVFASVVGDWSADDVNTFRRLIERLGEDWARRGPAPTRPRPAVRPAWRSRQTTDEEER